LSTEQASEAQGPSGTPRSAAALWAVIALAAAAMLLTWAAASVTWFTQPYSTPFTGDQNPAAKGSVVRPELVPLGLAALAAVAAVLATRGWFRRIVGVFIVLAAGLLAWRALGWQLGPQEFDWTPPVPPGSMPSGPRDSSPLGPVLGALAGVVFALAGALVVARAGRMPEMGAKYSAPGEARKRRSPDPDKRLWDALDEGDDPTADR
jgi:hypothetical protein